MTIEEIDPQGDVTIDCAGAWFRVSTKALSLASPVFQAMFQPAFKEGIAISTQSDPIVKLPDDNPDAFRIFSNVAHHNAQCVPKHPQPETLFSLAIFIDKYTCIKSVAGYGGAWVQQATLLEGHSAEDLWYLLQFSYSLELQQGFSDIARGLLHTHAGKFHTWTFAIENMGILPEGILDHLDNNREAVSTKTNAALMALAEIVSRNKCNICHAFVGAYIQHLGHHGILPGTPSFVNKSFMQVSKAAESIPKYVFHCKNSGTSHFYKLPGDIEQRAFLAGKLRDCSEEEVDMCLTCIDQGSCDKHKAEKEEAPSEVRPGTPPVWNPSSGNESDWDNGGWTL